ncbi:MAG: T9SS type A sorting domain-containing protein [Bacteroidetes bacterium]|nr:T9SS type A sorting domain-containing protein [Bacteroidota bacterium]
MSSILRRLVFTIALCVAAQVSFAYNFVVAELQKIENGTHGNPCATVYVELWEHYTDANGQQYNRFCGSATYKIGDCGGKITPRSDCPDPVALDSGLMTTEAASPICVSEMLSIPGVSDMMIASIDSALSGVALRPTGVRNKPAELPTRSFRLSPNPATAFVTIDIALPDLNNAVLSIYDASGKEVRQQKIMGHRTHARFTMDVSSLPRGTFSAILSGINETALITQLVLQ